MYVKMKSGRSPRAAAIAALLLALAGCVTVPPPDVFVIDLEPLESGALEQRVRVELRIQNPSPEPIAVSGMSLRLVVNGQPLARGVSDEHFTVPPLGEATTSIVTSTSLIDLLRQIEGARSRTNVEYRLEGTLYLDNPPGRSISFRHEGALEPPEVRE